MDLLEDNSDYDKTDLFSLSSESEKSIIECIGHNDIPLPPAHIKFQQFLQHVDGHECAIFQVVHCLGDTVLGTFQISVPNDENTRVCHHVFCYKSLT